MAKLRIIPRLDIKGNQVIKSVQMEGLRKMGDPREFARIYYEQGADELIFSDVVASLYGRNSLLDIVRNTASETFVPLTVGGGIRSVEDVYKLLRSGADKVSLNTAAIERPELISEIAEKFGSQAVVIEVQAKHSQGIRGWEALYDNGREHSGRDAVAWATEASKRGAGEVLLTSIDREGTRKGFDVDLLRQVAAVVHVPIIASGGFGKLDDISAAINEGKADAVAVADALHYKRFGLGEIKQAASEQGLEVRL